MMVMVISAIDGDFGDGGSMWKTGHFFSHQVMAVLMGNIVDLFGKKVAIHGDSVGKLRF